MTPIVVVSYNIHRGVGLDLRLDLDRIAAIITETRADVVALQEVVRDPGGMHTDQAESLAQALGMTLVMGDARAWGEGTYGNAVLTRLPVLGTARCDLSHGAREPRGALRVDVAAGDRPVRVFNAHFGLAFRERRAQVELLGRFLCAGGGGGPRVLLGDFNEWHPGPVTRRLRREFRSPRRRLRRTHPAPFPLFKLDRIYWDAELEADELRVHQSRLARVASDHLPVVAHLRLRRESPVIPWVTGDALRPAE
ncbi:MAG: endonuclease/exonuclease/phosphatase family protein [Candidatus Rokuibacteriota bacterium]